MLVLVAGLGVLGEYIYSRTAGLAEMENLSQAVCALILTSILIF